MVAAEMKGHAYDKDYDMYARSRKDTYQKTTAGDAYGLDEKEDDGLKL